MIPKFKMIVCITEKNTAYKVEDAAYAAGARAITVLKAEGYSMNPVFTKSMLRVSPDKDVVITLVTDDVAQKVFNAIAEGTQIDEPRRGIIWMLDVENVRTNGLNTADAA